MAVNERFLISIGATHPWNVAGVGVDARVAYEYGLLHAVALVGVTAQDEQGLHAAFALPATVVREQLRSLPSHRAAIHAGVLFDRENLLEVAHFLKAQATVPLVVDPVFADTFGSDFSDDQTVEAFRTAMLPLRSVLTPNLPEAERLLDRDISNVEAMVDAARALQARGPHAVLLKGGHLAGDPVDVLASDESVELFSDPRLPHEMRGTGCMLAAALACELARERSLVEAVVGARAYVRRYLSGASRIFWKHSRQ